MAKHGRAASDDEDMNEFDRAEYEREVAAYLGPDTVKANAIDNKVCAWPCVWRGARCARGACACACACALAARVEIAIAVPQA